jgi:hypothetical protein
MDQPHSGDDQAGEGDRVGKEEALMLELLAGVSSFTVTIPTIVYYRYRRGMTKAREGFLLTVLQRRESLWEEERLEKANACKHPLWVEVQAQTGELVAFLCLNTDCGQTLYLDEWKPRDCVCEPSKDSYKTWCVVKYHAGKAALLGEPKSLPEPARETVVWSYTCACAAQGKSVAKALNSLISQRWLSPADVQKLVSWAVAHIQACHDAGFHVNDSPSFKEWTLRTQAHVTGHAPRPANYMQTTWSLLSGTPKRSVILSPKFSTGGLVESSWTTKYNYYQNHVENVQVHAAFFAVRNKQHDHERLLKHLKATKDFQAWLRKNL